MPNQLRLRTPSKSVRQVKLRTLDNQLAIPPTEPRTDRAASARSVRADRQPPNAGCRERPLVLT